MVLSKHSLCSVLRVSRRRFLGVTVAVVSLFCQTSLANYSLPLPGCRTLALGIPNSAEPRKTAYRKNALYPVDTLAELKHLLGNQISQSHSNLPDLLSRLENIPPGESTWKVISLFRSESGRLSPGSSGILVSRNSFFCAGGTVEARLAGPSLHDQPPATPTDKLSSAYPSGTAKSLK